MDKLGVLGRSVSGQKVCEKFMKSYNNRATPEFCDNCDNYLGGRYIAKDKKNRDSQLITTNIASVRANKGGHPTRTFVDVSLNKVRIVSYSNKMLCN